MTFSQGIKKPHLSVHSIPFSSSTHTHTHTHTYTDTHSSFLSLSLSLSLQLPVTFASSPLHSFSIFLPLNTSSTLDSFISLSLSL